MPSNTNPYLFSPFMKSPYFFLLSLSAASAAWAGTSTNELITEDKSSDRWQISAVSAGAAWRHYGELSYRGGSRSQGLSLPSFVGGNSLDLPSIGTEGEYADRDYNDGYVNQNGGTADHGLTWFWGYDSASQVQGDSLVYSATGARSAYRESSTYHGGLRSNDDMEGFSPQIDILITPPESSPQMFDGFLFSFSYFGDDQDGRYSNFGARQTRDDYRLDFTDSYDLDGVIPPSEGYQGSYDGPGASIGNLPTSRYRNDVLINTDVASFTNSISTSFELDSFSLAFGPTFSGLISDQWQWQASCGATFNVLKWSASQTENLSVTQTNTSEKIHHQWKDKDSGTTVRLGVFARGELIRYFSNDIFIKTYLQGEMAESLEVDLGPSSFDLKQAGYSLGLSIGKKF